MKKFLLRLMCLTLMMSLISCTSGGQGKSLSGYRDGATEFEGREYKVIRAEISWHEADRKCREMGGTLASVKTKAASDFMNGLIGEEVVWLGGSDEVKEGDWLWRDGSRMIFHNWANHEPDNWYDGTEHWLVGGWYDDGTWGDTQGHFRKPITGYVCEWE